MQVSSRANRMLSRLYGAVVHRCRIRNSLWSGLRPSGVGARRGKAQPAELETLEPRLLPSADLAMRGLVADGTDLHVDYDVINQPVTPFGINVYGSSNGGATVDLLLGAVYVDDPSKLEVGAGHRVTLSPDFTDIASDYSLFAELDTGGAVIESNEDNNTGALGGGVFVSADGTLHVHGTAADDAIDIVQPAMVKVDLNGVLYAYEQADVSHIVARGHDGHDTIEGGSALSKDMWVFGGAGDDNLTGGKGHDRLAGGHGTDYLKGREGHDLLEGQAGDDTIIGDAGNDTLTGGEGDDWLKGEQDDDALFGGGGNDILEGGRGEDSLVGGEGDDQIEGNEHADWMEGNEGDDTLLGGYGHDTLYGGAGHDHLEGNADADQIDGGEGDDTLKGGFGQDLLIGGAGHDHLEGNAHADELHGGEGNDTLIGGDGDDVLHGDAGDDHIEGNAGADWIHGGDGDDVLEGGGGTDTLIGGKGFDDIEGVVDVNTAPTGELAAQHVIDGMSSTWVDLHAAFEDAEHLDSELTFEVVSNDNAYLLDAVVVDSVIGILQVCHHPGALGTANLVIRATDPMGLSADATMAVHVTAPAGPLPLAAFCMTPLSLPAGLEQSTPVHRAGDFDHSFGIEGVSLIDVGGNDRAFDGIVLADGSIVVAGKASVDGRTGFALARVDAAGRPVASFGHEGVVFCALQDDGGAYRPAESRAIGLLDNGHLLVAGLSGAGSTLMVHAAQFTQDGAFVGEWRRDISSDFLHIPSNRHTIHVQNNGAILLAGGVRPGSNMNTAVASWEPGPDAYHATQLDLGGEPGWAATTNDYATVLSPDGNGGILVAGPAYGSDFYDIAVTRLLESDLSRDISFNDGNVLRYDFGEGVDLSWDEPMAIHFEQGTGNIILAGSQAGNRVTITKLESDGADLGTYVNQTVFGQHGFSQGHYRFDEVGRLLAAGDYWDDTSVDPLHIVARFANDGASLDTGFGDNGVADISSHRYGNVTWEPADGNRILMVGSPTDALGAMILHAANEAELASFEGLPFGEFQDLQITWTVTGANLPDAVFGVYDGHVHLADIVVDQTVDPTLFDAGLATRWYSLGHFVCESGTLTVTMKDGPAGTAVADDARLPAAASIPLTDDFDDYIADDLLCISGQWDANAGHLAVDDPANDTALALARTLGPINEKVLIDCDIMTAGQTFLVFDYASPTQFKYLMAELVGGTTLEWQLGHRDAEGWNLDCSIGTDTNPQLWSAVQVALDGQRVVVDTPVGAYIHNYTASIADGQLGLGSFGSSGGFDNLRIDHLVPQPGPLSYEANEGDGVQTVPAGQGLLAFTDDASGLALDVDSSTLPVDLSFALLGDGSFQFDPPDNAGGVFEFSYAW